MSDRVKSRESAREREQERENETERVRQRERDRDKERTSARERERIRLTLSGLTIVENLLILLGSIIVETISLNNLLVLA